MFKLTVVVKGPYMQLSFFSLHVSTGETWIGYSTDPRLKGNPLLARVIKQRVPLGQVRISFLLKHNEYDYYVFDICIKARA